MKTIRILLIIVVLALASCQEENPLIPSGSFLSRTNCKNDSMRIQGTSDECIEYSYNGSTLDIKHVNAGFNCCPGEFNVSISVEGNVILIDESAVSGDCFCLCLYDVDYRIARLPAGKYEIRVKGNVDIGTSQPLQGTIDLSSNKTGSVCKERNSYPWGM